MVGEIDIERGRRERDDKEVHKGGVKGETKCEKGGRENGREREREREREINE